MSTTNENILKSLAVLEQNLKDINSAKEQVNNVVKSSSDLAKVIQSYNITFESLSVNVKAVLEDSRKFNNDSIKKLSEQTTNFSKEIAKLTEFDVSKSLKSIESETIKHFQQNLSKPLNALDENTKKIKDEVVKLTEFDFLHSVKNIENKVSIQFEQNLIKPIDVLDNQTKIFKEEVTRLTAFDFQNSFNKIEKEVVNQFNVHLKEQLLTLDNKGLELQSKIDEFKTQILRIEKIDLESYFNELLTTLSSQTNKQHIELNAKYEEVKSKTDNVILRFDQQIKEITTLRTLLFVTIGIIIIGIIINFVMK